MRHRTLRPVTLRPPDLVPLDDHHERLAVEAMAALLADHLDRHATNAPDASEPA